MNGNKALVLGLVGLLVLGGIIYLVTARTPLDVTPEAAPIIPATQKIPSTTKTPAAPVAKTKTVSYVSQSTAVLNGEVNPNGVQTSYWYEYGLSDSLGNFSTRQLIGAGYVSYSSPMAIYALQSNKTYFFRIGAENQYGKSYGAITSFTTTNLPPPPYIAPTAQTNAATNITANSVFLNGMVNPHGATTSYWFEYGTSISLGNTTPTQNAGADNVSTTVASAVSGLTENTTYYYRINAQSGYGIANGNIFSFNTLRTNPEPPLGNAPSVTTEEATSVGKTTATLHGRVNPNASETTYYFEYGKATLFGLFSLDTKTTTRSAGSGTASVRLSAGLNSLDPDSTYYYRLTTNNKYGTSTGAIYSFTTKR